VLDNEGEFASLREAVDVLLVGASGELSANPRHAALLAPASRIQGFGGRGSLQAKAR
jgi:hypothetical protein